MSCERQFEEELETGDEAEAALADRLQIFENKVPHLRAAVQQQELEPSARNLHLLAWRAEETHNMSAISD